MKIAFFGTPRFAQIILSELIKTEFKPQLVITGPDRKKGRGQALEATTVKIEAQKHNISVSYEISTVDESFDLAILVAYGHIIPKEILKIPKLGFINVHPSPLPKYRGPSPIQSAILAGENETGVTIMKLDQELDHGPIISQAIVPINSTDTYATLTEKLGHLGASLLTKSLPKYIDGTTVPASQNHKLATTTQKITKKDGHIDTENPPEPQTLGRMIRAFYPWPTVWFELNGKKIKLLPQNKIQMEGKQPLSLQEFKNGYPYESEQIIKLLD